MLPFPIVPRAPGSCGTSASSGDIFSLSRPTPPGRRSRRLGPLLVFHSVYLLRPLVLFQLLVSRVVRDGADLALLKLLLTLGLDGGFRLGGRFLGLRCSCPSGSGWCCCDVLWRWSDGPHHRPHFRRRHLRCYAPHGSCYFFDFFFCIRIFRNNFGQLPGFFLHLIISLACLAWSFAAASCSSSSFSFSAWFSSRLFLVFFPARPASSLRAVSALPVSVFPSCPRPLGPLSRHCLCGPIP